ncbi:MAG: isopentenyl phosphate kinase, partial [Halobacteriota archaeon]|nr:isopentenyl phosphate kinase [Halobacteriota archaeon]
MSYLSILKIGGSVITEKGRESSARYDEMQRVSEEIAKTRKTDLVLVHGAGSFGHIPADKYDLNRTFNPKGILVTHNTVKELNRIFLDILSKEGLHVVPVHPMGCTVLANGRIKSMFTEGIELMLEKRTIPVLHGDVVFDEKVGVKILSGDQLVSYLARNMK